IGALLFCLLALPAFSQHQDWKANPRELVRKAVLNENQAEAVKEHFTYRDVKRTKNGTIETKQMVETPQVVLGRLVAINGKPLTEAERQKEDGRLNRLINNPDELAKKKKEQQDDDQRARRMVRAIPDAFNFEYVSTEPGKDGDIVTLKFTPDPKWDPPNRELQVFTGMSGTMKIAVPQYRMALMQATLFKDVEFGWGFLGKLDKGGDFMIEQSQVYGNHWDLTHMKLHFTGKVLMVKSLNIQQDEQTSDYRPVPQMTVAQALDKLKEAETEYAKAGASGGGK
ncbi:MAG TPA: hypothetical protein VFP40_20140, partial [Terriglobales bacterium]|nr:hypothetical protein [Terriglobales bacterium]